MQLTLHIMSIAVLAFVWGFIFGAVWREAQG